MFKLFGSKNFRNELSIFRDELNGLVEVAQEEKILESMENDAEESKIWMVLRCS
jgi:hypothetical protein